MKLHFLTKGSLRDDYQSTDTNPADLKLRFNSISKHMLNLNYSRLQSRFLIHIVCVPKLASIKFIRQMGGLLTVCQLALVVFSEDLNHC